MANWHIAILWETAHHGAKRIKSLDYFYLYCSKSFWGHSVYLQSFEIKLFQTSFSTETLQANFLQFPCDSPHNGWVAICFLKLQVSDFYGLFLKKYFKFIIAP